MAKYSIIQYFSTAHNIVVPPDQFQQEINAIWFVQINEQPDVWYALMTWLSSFWNGKNIQD